MNPLRTRLIRQHSLQCLEWSGDYPVTDGALRTHVDAMVKPPMADDEWMEHIKWLLEEKAIVKVKAKFDSTLMQYTITEKGSAMLASL